MYDTPDINDNALIQIALMSHISMTLEKEGFVYNEDGAGDFLVDFHILEHHSQTPDTTGADRQTDITIVVYWNNEEMSWRHPLYYSDSLVSPIDSAKEKMDYSRITAEILSAMLRKEQLFISGR